MDMDEAISQLVSITACTPEIARQYVQLADGDTNQAVQLFFENGGADLAANESSSRRPPPPIPSSSRPPGTGDAQNPISLGDDDNVSDDNDPEVTGYRPARQDAGAGVEDDEAMARRLQEEMYGNSEEQPIRAPIARQSDTLLGPGGSMGPMMGPGLDEAVEERMHAFQRRRPGISFPNRGYNPR